MKTLLAVLFASVALAQPPVACNTIGGSTPNPLITCVPVSRVCINAGGPEIASPTFPCSADTYFSGGTVFSDVTMGGGTLGTLRYGNFSYTIPAPPGLYPVQLTFVEPNKIAAGQRLFNVTVNGITTPNIDLFALAGLRQQFVLNLLAISAGSIKITFTTVVWNALVNEITIGTPLLLAGYQQPPLGVATLFSACCNGLYLLSIRKPNGSVQSIVGVEPNPPIASDDPRFTPVQ